MLAYLIIFLIVFALNVVPFFMPATWTVLAFMAVVYKVPLLPLALVGAISATLGRLTLAKLSRVIIRQRFLSEKTRKNIDDIKTHLEKRKAITFGVFLFYAFGPLPSNQLFIAYGLTDMALWFVAAPFFLGRLLSYTVLSFSVVTATRRFLPQSLGSLFGGYFIVSQILTILVIYLFTKVHWHELFTKKKVELIK